MVLSLVAVVCGVLALVFSPRETKPAVPPIRLEITPADIERPARMNFVALDENSNEVATFSFPLVSSNKPAQWVTNVSLEPLSLRGRED